VAELTAVAIPEAPPNTTVPTDNGDEAVTRIGFFTLPYRDGPLDKDLVALNHEDGPDGATVNTDTVADWFLYARSISSPASHRRRCRSGNGRCPSPR
jgi:hypothetical protein